MSDKYHIDSNKESGEGRFDIQLMPKYFSVPGVLIEVKADNGCSGDKLVALAHIALNQINKHKYNTEMKARGVSQIIKCGFTFCGKNIEIVTEYFA